MIDRYDDEFEKWITPPNIRFRGDEPFPDLNNTTRRGLDYRLQRLEYYHDRGARRIKGALIIFLSIAIPAFAYVVGIGVGYSGR